jgi:hypothetical protein
MWHAHATRAIPLPLTQCQLEQPEIAMQKNRIITSLSSSTLALSLSAAIGLLAACGADASNAEFVGDEAIDQQEQELIGGTAAAPYHFRSTVAIGDVCTAAKVGPRLYLTAAHCVAAPAELPDGVTPTNAPDRDGILAKFSPGTPLVIAYGLDANDQTKRSTVGIVKTSVHPTWLQSMNYPTGATSNGAADVAVVEVDTDLTQIPQARVELGEVQPGAQVTKVGFGCEDRAGNEGNVLGRYKTADAWLLPRSELVTGNSKVIGEWDAVVVDASYLLTSGQARDPQRASLCPGDSGGPLYIPNNSDPRVVGVNSDYQFMDTSGVSWTDWHTRLSLRSRHSVGRWLLGLKVNTVGGDLYEGKGGLTMERWNNASGVSVNDIPVSRAADSTQNIQDFEIYPGSSNNGSNYGVRVRGYLTAPKTGSYTFWIAGDDNVSLLLSSDESASNKQRIAYHQGYTAARDWNVYSTQKSAAVSLVAGRRYYIEALMKEGGGGDNLAVGWNQPGQENGYNPLQLVPSYLLTPYSNASSCTCRKGCNAIKPATAPKQYSGFDENCYFFPNLGSSVSSSSMTRVNINGQDVPNATVNSSSYPARRDGGYYLYLESTTLFGSTTISN